MPINTTRWPMIDRRHFIQFAAAAAAAGVAATAATGCAPLAVDPPAAQPRISLGQWSLHGNHFGRRWREISARYSIPQLISALREDHAAMMAGPLDPLDFAPFTRETFGIDAVEYVNTFYFDKARDDAYLDRLDRKAKASGVTNVLVMCDALGNLGAPEAVDRSQVVENHVEWLAFASALDCRALRVNAASDATLPAEEQSRLAADGLQRLCRRAEAYDLFVVVENHGGLSSNGAWLADTIRRVDHPLIGTLPDFGNFKIAEGERYDPYEGVAELMPFARGVSAKAYDFDPRTGMERTLDYRRLFEIVVAAGFDGHVGIEYEGYELSEIDGIRATKRLIERTYPSERAEHPGAV